MQNLGSRLYSSFQYFAFHGEYQAMKADSQAQYSHKKDGFWHQVNDSKGSKAYKTSGSNYDMTTTFEDYLCVRIEEEGNGHDVALAYHWITLVTPNYLDLSTFANIGD